MKTWLKVTHSATGVTSVTCSIQAGSLSARWTVKCFVDSIPTGITEARRGAEKALSHLQEAAA